MLGLPGTFYRDILLVFLVTVLLSSLLSYGAGGAADYYFGETISSFIGDFGEYDLIITLNEDPEGRGEKELQAIVEREFPDGRLKKGIPLASQENYFLSLPEEKKTRKVFMEISDYFSEVPGYAGTSIITEPRLSLRGVPPAVRSFLEEELVKVEGVSLSYPIATGMDLLLTSTREAPEITRRVEEMLKEYQILEITLPVEEGGREPDHTAALQAYLEKEYGLLVEDISSPGEGEPLIVALLELRRFLEYLVQHGGSLDQALAEAHDLLPYLEDLFVSGNVLLDGAADALEQYQDILEESRRLEGLLREGESVLFSLVGEEGEAYVNRLLLLISLYLRQVEELQEEILGLDFVREQFHVARDTVLLLEEALEQGTAVSPERAQRLLPLLLEMQEYRRDMEDKTEDLISFLNHYNPLLPLLSNFQETLYSLEDLLISGREVLQGELFSELNQGLQFILSFLETTDGEELQSSLQEMQRDLEELAGADWVEMIQGLEILGVGLPSFEEDDLSQIFTLMDDFLKGHVLPPSEGIYLLLPGSFSLEGREEELAAVLGVSASFTSRSLGLIHPNLHVEVLRVTEQARLIIISIMAFLFTLLSLLLDQSLIISAIRERALWLSTPLSFLWDKVYGSFSGGILFTGIIYVSGGEVPYLDPIHYLLVGGVTGLLVALLSPKINPLNKEEMMAGLSMGLTFTDLMRIIIIPMGRPGLLYVLNRPRMLFA